MVAISKKKYEEMGETLEILSDPETAIRILKSIKYPSCKSSFLNQHQLRYFFTFKRHINDPIPLTLTLKHPLKDPTKANTSHVLSLYLYGAIMLYNG